MFSALFGALEGIRIPDLPLRRRTLYPAELQAHIRYNLNQLPFAFLQRQALKHPLRRGLLYPFNYAGILFGDSNTAHTADASKKVSLAVGFYCVALLFPLCARLLIPKVSRIRHTPLTLRKSRDLKHLPILIVKAPVCQVLSGKIVHIIIT